MKLLALVFCTACLGGGHWPDEVTPDYQAGAKSIIGVTQYPSYTDWQRSGFWRADDGVMSGPVYVVLSGDGTACIVSAAVWAIAKPRDYVRCAPWRMRRP